MRIRFTADSTCDMSPEFIERFDVRIIPLSVQLEGCFYKDGIDIFPDDIITHVNRGAALPKTAAINIDEYRTFFVQTLADCDAVIHFNIASGMSSCYQNACLAAEGQPVWCIDSHTLSSGIALLLAAAHDMAAEGSAPEEIVAALEKLYDKTDVSFVIDRLDFLYKGGRCSMVSMLGANVLHLRPCIEVTGGEMSVGKKYRGTFERCLRQYLSDRLKNPQDFDTKRVCLVHTGIPQAALDAVRDIVLSAIPFAEVYIIRAGCSITSHCGENVFSVMMMRK